MSEEKRWAKTISGRSIEVLAGPYKTGDKEYYWAHYPGEPAPENFEAELLTFPPKAEYWVAHYPFLSDEGSRLEFYDSLKEAREDVSADRANIDSAIFITRHWQDRDDQWHAELLNDE